MNLQEKTIAIEKIRKALLDLKKSPLYAFRTEHNSLPVVGGGSLNAQIVFVGEAPGKNEAKTGKPFCGAAGKILDGLLSSIKLGRDDIYITNIVNDRPPFNRDPTPEEITCYGPFLDKQLDIIQPKVIATLGRYSMTYVMEKFGLLGEIMPISKAHGQVWKAKTSYGTVTIIPLYHPAAAIYNQKLKGTLLEDFKVLKKYAKTKN